MGNAPHSDQHLLRSIQQLLNSPRLRENLEALFIEVLHWGNPQAGIQLLQVGAPINRTLTLIPIAQLGQVPVYRHDWEGDKLPNLTERRAVHRALSRVAREHLLCYVAADGQQASFVRGRPIGQGEGKRSKIELRSLPYEVGSPARTTIERLAELAFSYDDFDLFDQPRVTAVADKLDRAFDVEAVTREFFEGFKAVFGDLWKRLEAQSGDRAWAHDYALQLLNRAMFLCFVQRKRWLGDDPNFVSTFWNAYRTSGQPPNTFFDDWLSVLFFEAFCNRFQPGRQDRQYLPQRIRDALGMAPFLNGGLFTHNKLDEACTDYSVTVGDELFVALLDSFQGSTPGLFQRYNFTISESTPFDQEVAVDPVMIGKVYESLVNVSEETKERGEAGIFYTPRIEIDLMCRLSLVEWLTNHLGAEHKDALYEAVFAYEPEDQTAADDHLAQANLWPRLDDLLRSVTVLDPACGSGSFLVGMLAVLDDLLDRADYQLGQEESPYVRKRGIIAQSLYGVDVMGWAVATAELRLWLQLVIDTEFDPAELHISRRPLLPNLSFKVRPGDSLVQEVGGINFGLHRMRLPIPRDLSGRLTQLKGQKRRYYNGEKRGLKEEMLRAEEVRLFRQILRHKEGSLQEEVGRLARRIEMTPEQLSLAGMIPPEPKQLSLNRRLWRRQLEEKKTELIRVEQALQALRGSEGQVPFVWDIAFVEVFEGPNGGFDIVIGNPPYVRQERIRDPKQPPDQVTVAEKRAYKAKLANSIYAAWPHSFGYDWRKGKPRWKLDARSDLYIYFYLHGLSLLNDQGAFCFITSNSWLDVGYGRDLQRFLLTRGQVKLVIDNQARRSFPESDVNTVIVLLGAPRDTRSDRQESLEHTARFVMLTVPFEEVLDPIIWEEVVEASDRRAAPEYRVHPARQADLLESGMDPQKGRYTGDKWGGKYLRAPDIYHTVLARGAGFLEPMSDYFRGERYLNTGGADGFFILTHVTPHRDGLWYVINRRSTLPDGVAFEGYIEGEYLVPLVKDYTKVDKRIEIRGYDAYCFVVKGEPSISANKYIQWGEFQGYHQRSVTKLQKPWYKPTRQMLSAGKILVPRSFNDTFAVYWNPREYLSLRFYRFHLKKGSETQLAAFLNSTLIALVLETLGNKSLGQGVLDFFMADFLSLRLPFVQCQEMEAAFRRLCTREIRNVWQEYGVEALGDGRQRLQPLPDRRALDDIIFDVLGLTRGERDAVYEAVINLVEARLSKARSLKRRR